MVSTFSPNISLEEPANGDFVGTWDSPVNANMTAIDLGLGQCSTVGVSVGTVNLSTVQFRSASLVFTGVLTGNVTINAATGKAAGISGRTWTVDNQCTNSSAYVIFFQSSVSGAQYVALPPFEPVDIYLEAAGPQAGSIKFRNLDRIGAYVTIASTLIPLWIQSCAFPPYLLCDGTAFSSALYPGLALALGGNILPDARGRYIAGINLGTGRITTGSSTGGVDGDTKLASGGSQTTTLSSANIPLTTVTDIGHSHTIPGGTALSGIGSSGFAFATTASILGGIVTTSTNVTGLTVGNAVPTNFSNLPPTLIGGITLIRAG